MNTNDRVILNGRLYTGNGIVEAVCLRPSIADISSLPSKLQNKLRPNQPFPQVWVRAANGKLYHYNGNDVTNGMVTDAPAIQATQLPQGSVLPENLTMAGTLNIDGEDFVVYVGAV
jgi:hypothetical protein